MKTNKMVIKPKTKAEKVKSTFINTIDDEILPEEEEEEEYQEGLSLHKFELLENPLCTQNAPEGSWAFPALFNIDQKGKKRMWQIGYNAADNERITEGGCVGGVILSHSRVVISAGGKSLSEQVLQDARTKYIKKGRAGYRINLDDEVVKMSPSLAAKYQNPDMPNQDKGTLTKLYFPVLIQMKIDGIRMCIFMEHGQVTLYSRGNITYNSEFFKNHIAELEQFFMYLPAGWNLDGEAFSFELSFDQINGACRANVNYNPNVERLKIYIFSPIVANIPMNIMYTELVKAYYNYLKDGGTNKYFEVLYSHEAHSHEEILKFHDDFVLAGGEGAMIRKLPYAFENSLLRKQEKLAKMIKRQESVREIKKLQTKITKFEKKMDKLLLTTHYKSGRNQNLLKVKKFEDMEFEVVDILEAEGDDRGTALFVLTTEDGKTFNCRPIGSRKLRAHYLTNKDIYIGKFYTVKYFRFTDKGVPLLPSGKAFRKFKDGVDF